MNKEKKVKKLSLPQLVCIKKPDKNCNNGFYRVRIPINFLPKGSKFEGLTVEYQFIGLKGDAQDRFIDFML